MDVAITSVQAGVTDYNSAIRRTMKAAAQDGLRVKYPNSGLTRRLDSAVRQNVLDGVRAVNNDTLRQLGREFGADGIEISLHALCATDHLPYQGRKFTNKQFERLQNSLARPFGMWNCRHSMFPVLMSAPPLHTEEEIEEYRRNSAEKIEIDGRTLTRYEWTQEQRRIEAAIRRQKDIANLARASGDMKTARQASAAIDRLYARYDRISDAAGLDKQYSRAYVRGYREARAAGTAGTNAAGQARTWRVSNEAPIADTPAATKRQPLQKREEKRIIKSNDAVIFFKKAAEQEAPVVTNDERNLDFIRDDAKNKAASGLPKVVKGLPDEMIKATAEVDYPNVHGVVPKGADASAIIVMAGKGTSTPLRDLKRLYHTYPEYGKPQDWQKKSGTVKTGNHTYELHWYEANGRVPPGEIKVKKVK